MGLKGTRRGVHTCWAFWRILVNDGLSLSDCRRCWTLILDVEVGGEFVWCGGTALVRAEPLPDAQKEALRPFTCNRQSPACANS